MPRQLIAGLFLFVATVVNGQSVANMELFSGCSSVQLRDVSGYWVSDLSQCAFDGTLWISVDGDEVAFSGWEWSGTVLASLQESNRTVVQLKVYSEGEPSLMQVEMGMRNGALVLDPFFQNYCCGDGGGDLVKCPQEPSSAIAIGTIEAISEKTGESAHVRHQEAEPQVFTIVEEMPSFPGGESALFKYLGQKVQYPPAALEAGIKGAVQMTFVLDEQGVVRDPRVLHGIGGGCDDEAMRVVMAMPNWDPGKQRGKPVRVQYNLPIRFTPK